MAIVWTECRWVIMTRVHTAVINASQPSVVLLGGVPQLR